MACRQSLMKKGALLRRWYHPSLSHVVYRSVESDENLKLSSPSKSECGITKLILQQYSKRSSSSIGGNRSSGALFGNSKCISVSFFGCSGLSSSRYMSTGIGDGSENVEHLGDSADIWIENTVEVVTSQVPLVNEVAVAAADSAFPVSALQHLIDGVHSFTGLNWWAAIAITTILIRGATLPFFIKQLKDTYKLKLISPRVKEIKQKTQAWGMDNVVLAEGQKEIAALYRKYGVSSFTPLKGLLIQGSIIISFFFAITNMAEKVPSFKTGGALWFTDLTTPDSLYIFPILVTLSILINVELNGNYKTGTMKNITRIIAILLVPFTVGLPKAFFCYWITSFLFSQSWKLVMKHPEIQRILDLPGTPASPSTTSESALSSYSSRQQQDEDKELSHSLDSSKHSSHRKSSIATVKQSKISRTTTRGKEKKEAVKKSY